ncbi:hypothetical protein AK812_SmicGene33582 [Symbiodinium microadriaticum]|uniref:Uncharacterized protein n=1 Tax=Symbiodinium microadriaticum TaxID=2951 RepID=A0A1Q9CRA1_SYMMI|nr:hypothetical protein AK812_SmicGene33582 [Symbiodinium microadriaticum]
MVACRNVTEKPTEANLVRLLDLWSADWKHRRPRSLRQACNAVNGFLRGRFPNGTRITRLLWETTQEGGCGSKTTTETPQPGWNRWLDMHDKPVSFDARRYHMVEPHEGSMWALAAYVPPAYARATEQHRQALREAGFPLPQ